MGIDWFSIALGAAAVSFGIYTLILRKNSPEKLGKLVAMEKQWGAKKGNAVHLVAYSIAPILFGIVFILKALLGS